MYKSLPVVKRALDCICDTIPDDAVGIHGKLYDVTGFDHPGGATFVHMALGTDATALFETHHLNSKLATAELDKLRTVGAYTTAVAYDYTAYRCIRDIAYSIFPTQVSRRMRMESKRRLYAIVALTLGLHALSLSTAVGTARWGILCACAACMNTICGGYGHNALHRLEPAAILLDWNGLSCYEWLFEHLQSHHMYVNTEYDHDSIAMEPFVRWIPSRRRACFGPSAPYVKHVIYLIAEIAVAVQGNLVHRARWMALHDPRLPMWMRLAPFLFVVRVGSYVLIQGVMGFATALFTLSLAGYAFAYLAHLNHAFDGDGRPDFLLHQLRNTKDIRAKNVAGSILLFLDRQTLHHLFPTVDHTRLTTDVRDLLRVGRYMEPRAISELHAQVNRSIHQ
tara:strand:+ start:247 stop:1428 length:1182 start_codon:yes stop_codon:yes gene_type:complete